MLLLPETVEPELRATEDVDCVVPIHSYGQYHRLEEQLRRLGCLPDPEGPLCRWLVDEIVTDLMPVSEEVLGFGNRWYDEALKEPVVVQFSESLSVKVVNLSVFLATKFEAHRSRGGQYEESHDFEDIVLALAYSVDACPLVRSASPNVRDFLAGEMHVFLQSRRPEDVVSRCLPSTRQSLVKEVLGRMREISELAQ